MILRCCIYRLANSINIGRLIPQIIYYFWAYLQSRGKKQRFVIPSGNMGNAAAAIFAHKMGMPLNSLIIATNENDIAVNYYKNRCLSKQKISPNTFKTRWMSAIQATLSVFLELFGHDHEAFRKQITAVKITDQETIATIKVSMKKKTIFFDFHTAVGFLRS